MDNMADGSPDPQTRKVYIIALAVYFVLVVAFVGSFLLLRDDHDALLTAMYALGLLFVIASAALAYWYLVVLPKYDTEDASEESWEKGD